MLICYENLWKTYLPPMRWMILDLHGISLVMQWLFPKARQALMYPEMVWACQTLMTDHPTFDTTLLWILGGRMWGVLPASNLVHVSWVSDRSLFIPTLSLVVSGHVLYNSVYQLQFGTCYYLGVIELNFRQRSYISRSLGSKTTSVISILRVPDIFFSAVWLQKLPSWYMPTWVFEW